MSPPTSWDVLTVSKRLESGTPGTPQERGRATSPPRSQYPYAGACPPYAGTQSSGEGDGVGAGNPSPSPVPAKAPVTTRTYGSMARRSESMRQGHEVTDVTVRPGRFVPPAGLLDSPSEDLERKVTDLGSGRLRTRPGPWASAESLAEAFYENLDLRGAALGEDLSWKMLRTADRRILVQVCEGLMRELGPEVEYVQIPRMLAGGTSGETQCPACNGKGWTRRAFMQRITDQVDLVRSRVQTRGGIARFRSGDRSFHRLSIQHIHGEWRARCSCIIQMPVYERRGFNYRETCAVLELGRQVVGVERFWTPEQRRRKRAHKGAKHLPKVGTVDWGVGCKVSVPGLAAVSADSLWSFSRNRYECELSLARETGILTGE